MPQKIENKDIFSPDFLEPQKKSFKEIIELIKLMESEMKDVLKVQQQLVKTSDKKSVEGLKKRQRAVQSVNQVSKEMLKLEKQRKVASAQLALAETQEAKAVALTKYQLQQKKKAVKDEIIAEKGLIREYKKQSTRLNDLRKKYKDLILVQGKETRATRKLRKEITTLDSRLKRVDARVGQFQRSVGNYGKAFGKVSGVLSRFGLAVGGLAIVRNIGNIFMGFEQQSANLASVLGKTSDQITTLTKDAKRLGSITSFTAKEVLQLQTEFAKLGFNETEILNATEATLSLAAATGTELSEAAAVAGATLGGFGLGASETQRIVDVMAKSFSISALDMEKFKEAMKNAAPAARAVGISVEETTALLGTLASAGISGSKAGNNLKTSFINLNAAGITLEEGLEKVMQSEDKLGTATDLVGKRAAASFLVLAEGRKTTDELTEGLNNAGGAAERMARTQLDTLGGKIKLMTSAWEGFILSLEDGDGVLGGVMGNAIRFVTDLLGLMTDTKDSVADVVAEQMKFNMQFNESIKAVTDANIPLDARKVIIDDINEKYGEYLPSLITEKTTLEEITEIQKQFNIQAKERLLLASKQALLNKAAEDQEKILNQIVALRTGVFEGLTLGEEQVIRSIRAYGAEEEQIEKLTKVYSGYTELIAKYTDTTEEAAITTEELTDATDEGTDSTNESTKAVAKQLTGLDLLNKKLSEKIKLMRDEFVLNQNSSKFRKLQNEATAQKDEIDFLEAKLKLAENIEKFEGKKADVSDITGEEDLREEANKAVDDFVNIQVEGAEEIADNDKKYYEQRLTALKQFAAKAIEIANAKTDKEIENIDKELDANKTRQDQLQQLATQGNLTAEQSISAEIKRELELERQKEALEKKKARRQIILEGLDLLSSKIDNGDKDAVTSTLNDMTRLLGALAALPGFIDGTETTVGAALGKPQLNTGTDDYIVRVDGSEKILNPNMSARTGNMTTEEITRAAEMYSSGMFDQNSLIHPQVNALSQPFQGSNEILKKFDSLESTIRNKPILSDLKFDDLQKALIVTVEQNGDLKRAHYKLK
jgi:hypothetical protein